MKRSTKYTFAALLAAAGFVVSLALADTKPENKPTAAVDPQTAEMMKNAEEAGAPGAAHKKLEPFVGEWNAEVKMWMSPDAPPEVSKGTAKSIWILNGRFVQEEFSGEMMGKPFRGLSLTGYDNVRQKYRGVWVDDMSTTIVTSEGDVDPAGKVFTFGGNYSCAMTGEKNKEASMVYRVLNRDKHVFEMYEVAEGKKTKMMEITYTRK